MENREKMKPRNRIVRNLTIALIAVIAVAAALLISYSLTADPLRTTLGYVAIVFLPIILILAYALAITILHRQKAVTQTQP